MQITRHASAAHSGLSNESRTPSSTVAGARDTLLRVDQELHAMRRHIAQASAGMGGGMGGCLASLQGQSGVWMNSGTRV